MGWGFAILAPLTMTSSPGFSHINRLTAISSQQNEPLLLIALLETSLRLPLFARAVPIRLKASVFRGRAKTPSIFM